MPELYGAKDTRLQPNVRFVSWLLSPNDHGRVAATPENERSSWGQTAGRGRSNLS